MNVVEQHQKFVNDFVSKKILTGIEELSMELIVQSIIDDTREFLHRIALNRDALMGSRKEILERAKEIQERANGRTKGS